MKKMIVHGGGTTMLNRKTGSMTPNEVSVLICNSKNHHLSLITFINYFPITIKWIKCTLLIELISGADWVNFGSLCDIMPYDKLIFRKS